MTKQCSVCGREFMPKRERQVCCSKECGDLRHKEYVRAYMARRRAENGDAVRAYNREWMRKKRGRKRVPKEQTERIAADYAARQMAKTLEMVGRVKL